MLDPIIILAALLCGMASRALGLPALIGYLGAGFALHEIHISGGDILHVLAEMGITLLLFTIGLKLQPANLLKTNVWGTTLLQILIMQLAFVLLLTLAGWIYPGLQLGFGTVQLTLLGIYRCFADGARILGGHAGNTLVITCRPPGSLVATRVTRS